MNGAPAVSVVMTVYNREGFVRAAIESVLAQTFTDFELIVVDDCSTDRTVQVVEEYLADPRVRLVRNAHNLGQFPNRNHSATFARGDFLKYHDSDDVLYRHCLQTMMDALRSEPAAAFALTAHRSWPGGPCPMLLSPRLSYIREFLGSGMFQVGPACALFRREAFAALGGFSNEGTHSDYLFWLQACARVNVLLVSGDLFWYRLHAGQELSGRDAGYDGANIEWKVLAALNAPECPLQGDELEAAKRNAVGRVIRTASRDFRGGHWHLAFHRLRQTRLTLREWLKYGRRPRAVPDAGTPLGADSEYLIPDLLTRRPVERS